MPKGGIPNLASCSWFGCWEIGRIWNNVQKGMFPKKERIINRPNLNGSNGRIQEELVLVYFRYERMVVKEGAPRLDSVSRWFNL